MKYTVLSGEGKEFPSIVPWRKGDYLQPMTLAEAKREVVQETQARIEACRSYLREVRSLRASDITEDSR